MFRAQILQCFCVHRDISRARNTDKLTFDSRRVGEGTHKVKYRPLANALADWLDALHCRMVVGSEQKADTKVFKSFLRHAPCAFHVEAKRLQSIRCACLG